jgi:hypothetical protein
MQYPRILEIRISGDYDEEGFLDDYPYDATYDLHENLLKKDIGCKIHLSEFSYELSVEVFDKSEFDILDNCLVDLVEKYLGKVCVEVE